MAKLSKDRIKQIKQEIIMAKKLNEEHLLGQMQEAIQRYTGQHFPTIGQNWDILLNEIYPVVQFNIPSIYFKNPRIFLKPRTKNFIAKRRNPITRKMEDVFLDADKSAKTQESILNYMLGEINYKKEVQKMLFDALLFKFGVMWHGYKGEFGMTDEQSMFIKDEQIFVQRLSPLRFLKDPKVGISDLDKAGWQARSFDVPVMDLIEDPTLKFDKNKLEGKIGFGQKVDSGLTQLGGVDFLTPATKSLIEFTDKEFKNSMRARFAEVQEVFVRPTPKERREGSKGWVVLFADEIKDPIRDPSAWPYKAEGWPGQVLEFNPLNDQQFGLADIDTYSSIADQKNAIVNIQLRNAQENSKVWVGIAKDAGMSEEDLEMVQRGDQTIILFPGDTVSGKFAVASPSGAASSELYLIDQRIQKNLEDKSGVTDLKRGFLQSGEESATSVKIRAAGSSIRPSYRQDIMSDFLRDSFKFLNQLNKQFFTVDEAVRIMGSLDIEWSDKPSKEEIQADVDVDIDVISMLPENPEKEIQELQTVLALMIQGLTDPIIRAEIEKKGKTIDIVPVIENLLLRLKIKNPDIFRNIRPEESQGFVSVAEMRAARGNVEAVLSGQPELPSPPDVGQDHVARIEAYASILALVQGAVNEQVSAQLQQLILLHQQLLDEEQQKESPRSRSPLKSPSNPIQVI